MSDSSSLIIAMKNKRFTPEEDAIIIDLVENKKVKPWSKVAEYLPGRTGPQCRDRYNSSLYQSSVSKKWTEEEDNLIIQMYKEIGPRWVMISQFLPGRNGNSVKNRWHKSLASFHKIGCKMTKQVRRNKDLKHMKEVTAMMSPIHVASPAEISYEPKQDEKALDDILSLFTDDEYVFNCWDSNVSLDNLL